MFMLYVYIIANSGEKSNAYAYPDEMRRQNMHKTACFDLYGMPK